MCLVLKKPENIANNCTVSEGTTVKPVYSDHPRETKNVAFIDRWLLYTGSYIDNVSPWESS